MELSVEIVSVNKAEENTLAECLSLFSRFYQNVSKEKFIDDFLSKKWVILLKDGGRVVGFSTQTAFVLDDDVFLYSGDTIVAPEYWQKSHLSGAFCYLMMYLLELYPDQRCYWFLTSKGFRTFRYLPVFFKNFCPDFTEPPELKKLLDTVALERFQTRYNQETGIIAPAPDDNILKEEMCKLPVERKNDRYIDFFISRNPDYTAGYELACITEINPDNFRKSIFKVLENSEVIWDLEEEQI